MSSAEKDTATETGSGTRPGAAWALAGVVLVLGGLVRYLEQNVPDLAEGTAFGEIAAAIEYPVYAIVIGLLGNVVLTQLGVRDKLAAGFRTEFFIKTGTPAARRPAGPGTRPGRG